MGQAKQKNQRSCPALGRTITAIECGEGRNSEISCPADCPHNPFSPANYLSQFAPMETKMIGKALDLTAGTISRNELQAMMGSRDGLVINARHLEYLSTRKLVDGWAESGKLDGWRNDERVLVRCMQDVRVALWEVQRVEGDLTTVVIDLLQPELGELRINDVSVARGSIRFGTYLGWLFPYPGGWRTSGSVIPFDGLGGDDPLENFEILVRHLGAPAENRQAWLLQNILTISDAITETTKERDVLKYRQSDLREVTRHFTGKAAEVTALARKLRSHPLVDIDIEESPECDLEAAVLAPPEKGARTQAVMGYVKLQGRKVEARAMAMKRAGQLQEFLMDLAPGLVLEDEQIEDYGAKRRVRQSSGKDHLIPPALLDDIAGFDVFQQKFINPQADPSDLIRDLVSTDEPIPSFDGLTLLEVSRRPELRPQLVRHMKGQLRNIARMTRDKDDVTVDLTPTLKELGLEELIDPADLTTRNAVAPPPEKLPLQVVLTHQEIAKRVARALENPRALHERARSQAVLFDAATNLADATFSEAARGLAHEMCVVAFVALCPKLPAGFSPQISRLTSTYREIQQACAALPAGEAQERAYQLSGQALLAQGVVGIGRVAMADHNKTLSTEDLTKLAITVSAMIREISQAANPG